MDITTFCIILMYILAPMLLIGFMNVKAGLAGFIFGGLMGMIILVMTNVINIWALLLFIIALTAVIFFAKR